MCGQRSFEGCDGGEGDRYSATEIEIEININFRLKLQWVNYLKVLVTTQKHHVLLNTCKY